MNLSSRVRALGDARVMPDREHRRPAGATALHTGQRPMFPETLPVPTILPMLAIHPFEATISVVGVIVGAVVVLTLFFKCVSWLSGRSQKVKALTFGGVLDDRTCVTIHMNNGARIEQARVLGFIHERNDGVPYHLRGMLVVEHGDARRTLIRPDVIRFIEARPPGSAIT